MHTSTDNTPLLLTLIVLAISVAAYMNGSNEEE